MYVTKIHRRLYKASDIRRHISNKKYIKKKLLQSNKKNTDNPIRKCPKDIKNRHFPKGIFKCLVDIQQGEQQHYSLGKCK